MFSNRSDEQRLRAVIVGTEVWREASSHQPRRKGAPTAIGTGNLQWPRFVYWDTRPWSLERENQELRSHVTGAGADPGNRKLAHGGCRNPATCPTRAELSVRFHLVGSEDFIERYRRSRSRLESSMV